MPLGGVEIRESRESTNLSLIENAELLLHTI